MVDRPSILGPYRIERDLGAGGMGQVYAATHIAFGHAVAIKVLSDSASGRARERFVREARLIASLDHPNIVEVRDFLELGSRVAMVMELLQGDSLATLIAKGRLPTNRAIEIANQVASALETVHHHGVVHRDLKPSNVFVLAAPSRIVKVLDFGVAKSLLAADETAATQTGSLIGTPAYMAPEQIAALEVSPATDVYAYGELLFEMLTGERLFDGDGFEVLERKISGGEYRFELLDGIEGGDVLRDIVQRCTMLRPEQRPLLSEVRALLVQLASSTADATPSVESAIEQPPTEWERRHAKRRSWARPASVLFVIIGLGVLVGTGLDRFRQRRTMSPKADRIERIERIKSQAQLRFESPLRTQEPVLGQSGPAAPPSPPSADLRVAPPILEGRAAPPPAADARRSPRRRTKQRPTRRAPGTPDAAVPRDAALPPPFAREELVPW